MRGQLEDSEKGVWEKWGKWRAGIGGPGNETRKMKDGLIGRCWLLLNYIVA